jgi:hypothetical protein
VLKAFQEPLAIKRAVSGTALNITTHFREKLREREKERLNFNPTHLFGHGRAQNVAAMVFASILVFFVSLEAFRQAVPKLYDAPVVK